MKHLVKLICTNCLLVTQIAAGKRAGEIHK